MMTRDYAPVRVRRTRPREYRMVRRAWLPQLLWLGLLGAGLAAVLLGLILGGHVWIGGGALNA